MSKRKSIILLSGGLDSLVCLGAAKDEYHSELALTFDYGQKSAKQENPATARFSSTAWTMPSASVPVIAARWPLWTKSKCIKGDSHDDIRFHANPLFLLLRD